MRNPAPPTLMEGLVHALSRVDRTLSGRLAEGLERAGCSVEQWRVLVLLSDGAGHPMSEIAEFALLSAPSLTRIIDRMATDGLVHRRVDERDRRRVLVHITREGRELHRSASDEVQRQERALLDGNGRGDVERLLELLEGFAGRLR